MSLNQIYTVHHLVLPPALVNKSIEETDLTSKELFTVNVIIYKKIYT